MVLFGVMLSAFSYFVTFSTFKTPLLLITFEVLVYVFEASWIYGLNLDLVPPQQTLWTQCTFVPCPQTYICTLTVAMMTLHNTIVTGITKSCSQFAQSTCLAYI
jgi:hypothetical protein